MKVKEGVVSGGTSGSVAGMIQLLLRFWQPPSFAQRWQSRSPFESLTQRIVSVQVCFILRAAFENGFVNAVEDDCFDEGDWVFWFPASGGEVESEGNGVIANFADVGDFDVVVLSAVALCGVIFSFGAHVSFPLWTCLL